MSNRFAGRASVRVVSTYPWQRSLLALACAWPLLATAQPTSQDAAELDRVRVEGHRGASTEGTDSYAAGIARSSAKLELSLRDTPQSVVVITQQQILDRNPFDRRPQVLLQHHLPDPVDLRRSARCGSDAVLAVLTFGCTT